MLGGALRLIYNNDSPWATYATNHYKPYKILMIHIFLAKTGYRLNHDSALNTKTMVAGVTR